LYPETAEVLAFQDSATVCELTCAPVPERAIVVGEPIALLVTVTAPATLPAAVGLKITLNVSCCVGVSVAGVLAPLRLNPVPEAAMLETVTLTFPVLVTVNVCVADVPVFTLPKLRLVVLNERAGVEATPVPLNGITAGLLGALLSTDTLALAEPAEAGAN
jgi:hypothetical protein